MDTIFQVVGSIIVAVITTWGGLALKRQHQAKKSGMPGDESAARELAPSAPLMEYWAKALEASRAESKAHADELARRVAEELANLQSRVTTQEEERELDAQHIDALEQHIWLQKPPPPPARLRAQRSRP